LLQRKKRKKRRRRRRQLALRFKRDLVVRRRYVARRGKIKWRGVSRRVGRIDHLGSGRWRVKIIYIYKGFIHSIQKT
jgi:hypothetical protein